MRNSILMLTATALAGGMPLVVPTAAHAEVVADNGLCLDASGGLAIGRPIMTWPCNFGPNQSWRLSGGKLVDSSGQFAIVPTGGGRGAGLAVSTASSSSARWSWSSAVGGQLKLQGTGLCLDVKDANRNAGAAIVLWDCKWFNGAFNWDGWNQRFTTGKNVPVATLPPQTQAAVRNPASVPKSDRPVSGIIANGGGNVIANGGGNVIANGGANVIANGGANVVALGGNN